MRPHCVVWKRIGPFPPVAGYGSTGRDDAGRRFFLQEKTALVANRWPR